MAASQFSVLDTVLAHGAQIEEILICYVLGIRRACQRRDRIAIIMTPRDSPILEMTIAQFTPSFQLSVLI